MKCRLLFGFGFVLAAFLSTSPLHAQLTAVDYLNSGRVKIEKEPLDINGAIADLTKALQLDPKLAEAQTELAKAKTNKAEAEQRIAELNKAIAANPKDAKSISELAAPKAALGDLDSAFTGLIALYASSPEMSGDNKNSILAGMYAELADEKRRRNDWKGVLADDTKAIDLDPHNPRLAKVYESRGECRQFFHDFVGAQADFSQAITFDPRMIEAYVGRCQMKANGDDYDGALADCTKAISFAPDQGYLFAIRAVIEKRHGDTDGALADFTKAIALNPGDADSFFQRGLTKDAKGDPTAAADFTQALSIFSKAIADSESRVDHSGMEQGYAIGQGYTFLGRAKLKAYLRDFDGALADVDKAVALVPMFTDAYFERGLIKQLKDDHAGAIVAYRASLESALPFTAEENLIFTRFGLLLALRRLHQDESSVGLAKAVDTVKDPWMKTVGQFLQGKLAEADFFKEAAKGHADDITEQQLEAFYYAGMTHLLNGDVAGAKDLFTKCTDTKGKDYYESVMAKAELAHLTATSKPAN